MKRSLNSLFLILALAFAATAQGYTFTKTQATYADLSSDISLTQGQVWDDPDFKIPTGFIFPFWGNKMLDSILVLDFGVFTNMDEDTIIAMTGADLIDRGYDSGISQSSISYKLDGNPGARILKVQWKNVGFYGEYNDLNTTNWYANYQLWLHQDGTFEMRFGPVMIGDSSIAFDGDPGPIVGYGYEMDAWFLTGNPASPILSHFTLSNYGTLNGVPADGTLYRFTPGTIGITEHLPATMKFMNDEAGTSIVATEAVNINLMNIAGQSIIVKKLQGGESLQVPVGSLPAGIYLLKSTTIQGAVSVSKVFLR